MRQILMCKPGEFTNKSKADHLRAVAIKKLAKMIKSSESNGESEVVVSNKALQQKSC